MAGSEHPPVAWNLEWLFRATGGGEPAAALQTPLEQHAAEAHLDYTGPPFPADESERSAAILAMKILDGSQNDPR